LLILSFIHCRGGENGKGRVSHRVSRSAIARPSTADTTQSNVPVIIFTDPAMNDRKNEQKNNLLSFLIYAPVSKE